MSLLAPVHFEPWHVNHRLAELGLEERLLIQAADQGLSAWANCTEDHPPSYPGLSAWGETIRALRDALRPLGWSRLNESNLALTIDESKTIAISVSTGDEDTGKKDGHPRTSSAKGPRTVSAIASNQMFLPFVELNQLEPPKERQRQTWMLLIFRDKKAKEARYELSRPIRMDEDGHVDEWAERIILTPTKFDDIDEVGINNEPSPEIDLEIRKRA